MGSSIPRRTTVLGLAAAATLVLTSPATATALDSTARPDNAVAISVPAVAGGTQLWLDVEFPGLTDADVVVTRADSAVALRTTAVGAGAILPYDGSATILVVGTRAASEPDIAITVADADGQILHADHARLSLQPIVAAGDPDPGTTPPPGTPTTSAPTDEPPTPVGPKRPRPGLPKTGVSG